MISLSCKVAQSVVASVAGIPCVEKVQLIQVFENSWSKVFYVVKYHVQAGPVSADNEFQDLLRLRETADNTERFT